MTTLEPYGPAPSPRQLAWHELELYGFLHFTVNTFTDKEWGYGDESPAVFAPTDFDADQIAEAAVDGGLRALILTAKHHDGFCLWPSRHTAHSVRSSPWKAGRGDVVRAVAEACARRGLRFGVYLSPWDRNHPAYATPEYVLYYRSQLRELLTDYGPIFEVWHDGANGGDGYYGGARESRRIDKRSYYGWAETWDLVRQLQPGACIFSDAGPDVRWVGNEDGRAGETCWATQNRDDFIPGEADTSRLNRGDRPGTHWLPAECDVSIRPGWFYHESEDERVKSPERLYELYFASVGRGGSLLLNVPPDRRGRIHEADAASLAGFRRMLEGTFRRNLAEGAERVTVSGPAHPAQEPRALVDGNRGTHWLAAEGDTTPEIVLTFRRPVRFSVAGLREHLPLGQRIESFALDVWRGGGWSEIAAARSVGSRRLLRVPEVETDRVRLRVSRAAAPPALSELGLWKEAR
jgi:alpha-L-fucosidase